MVENVLSINDLQNQNKSSSPVSFVKPNGLKETTSFLGDLKGVLEVVRDITGLDVMGKVKEVTQANKETSSNAIKIESGINKQISSMPQAVEKTISFKLPKAIELIKEGLGNLPEEQTIKELKKQFEENSQILEPFIIKYLTEVTFLQ